MAKRVVTSERDASNPGPELGPVEVFALSDTRIFQDGPPTMLLDQAGLDRAAELSDAMDLSVSLTLEDLLPDDAGEVVLVTADDVPINLLSSETMTEAGIAPEHVTMGGMEVTGLHFYSFESGLTVYSPVDLLILDDPNGA